MVQTRRQARAKKRREKQQEQQKQNQEKASNASKAIPAEPEDAPSSDEQEVVQLCRSAAKPSGMRRSLIDAPEEYDYGRDDDNDMSAEVDEMEMDNQDEGSHHEITPIKNSYDGEYGYDDEGNGEDSTSVGAEENNQHDEDNYNDGYDANENPEDSMHMSNEENHPQYLRYDVEENDEDSIPEDGKENDRQGEDNYNDGHDDAVNDQDSIPERSEGNDRKGDDNYNDGCDVEENAHDSVPDHLDDRYSNNSNNLDNADDIGGESRNIEDEDSSPSEIRHKHDGSNPDEKTEEVANNDNYYYNQDDESVGSKENSGTLDSNGDQFNSPRYDRYIEYNSEAPNSEEDRNSQDLRENCPDDELDVEKNDSNAESDLPEGEPENEEGHGATGTDDELGVELNGSDVESNYTEEETGNEERPDSNDCNLDKDGYNNSNKLDNNPDIDDFRNEDGADELPESCNTLGKDANMEAEKQENEYDQGEDYNDKGERDENRDAKAETKMELDYRNFDNNVKHSNEEEQILPGKEQELCPEDEYMDSEIEKSEFPEYKEKETKGSLSKRGGTFSAGLRRRSEKENNNYFVEEEEEEETVVVGRWVDPAPTLLESVRKFAVVTAVVIIVGVVPAMLIAFSFPKFFGNLMLWVL